MTANTYCEKAFNHIFANTRGQYKLCCHASINPSLKKFTTDKYLPFEYFLSDEMEEIRNMMLSGKKIQGCEFCYNTENRGFKSQRQILSGDIPKFIDIQKHSVGIQLNVFGSSCNLSCYMCQPNNSSSKYKELKKIKTDIFDNPLDKNFDNKFFNHHKNKVKITMQDVLKNIEFVEYIQIIGGEPFISSSHWEFIDAIPDNMKSKIDMRYQTNLTTLKYKKWDINNYKNKFKHFKLYVSADHFGDRLSWIRYPINVRNFEINLQQQKDIIQQIDLTVSLLNVHDLSDIISYYKNKFDIKVSLSFVVNFPSSLSIKNLSKDEKIIINESFDLLNANIQQVPDFYYAELHKERIEEEYLKFISYIKQLDKIRNTNANKVFGWKIYD